MKVSNIIIDQAKNRSDPTVVKGVYIHTTTCVNLFGFDN